MIKEEIIIKGGKQLKGAINISGAKNATLPIMAASLLTDDILELQNIPHLKDITMMANLLISLGCKIKMEGHGFKENITGKTISIQANNISNLKAHYDIVSQMRASIVVLGPLLARCGRAVISMPGGCTIGMRPIDLHLYALEKLGAQINIKNGYVDAIVPKKKLHGAKIVFPKVSVGATENAVMAATLAVGQTIIENAAIESEIIDLIQLLRKMGAKILIEDRTIIIDGVEKLTGASHRIISDRIELGSYAIAALITNGEIEMKNVVMDDILPIKTHLEQCGAKISEIDNGLKISKVKDVQDNIKIVTSPYPGFPTDMQAQFAAFLSSQNINAEIQETIFENRFMHIAELNRMGANIIIDGNQLKIHPVKSLSGTHVNATDLRASMALIIAALSAQGSTAIREIQHLDRGYEMLEEKLQRCGADITRRII